MTREQELLSALAKTVFRLNGQLAAVGEVLAIPSGMTGAWWQVLGTVLRTPMSVSDIAREIGVTRQSVQRIADLLVEGRMAEYRSNPAHRRAKLLTPTDAGRTAVRRITPGHAAFAARLAEEMGVAAMEEALGAVRRISEALERLEGAAPYGPWMKTPSRRPNQPASSLTSTSSRSPYVGSGS